MCSFFDFKVNILIQHQQTPLQYVLLTIERAHFRSMSTASESRREALERITPWTSPPRLVATLLHFDDVNVMRQIAAALELADTSEIRVRDAPPSPPAPSPQPTLFAKPPALHWSAFPRDSELQVAFKFTFAAGTLPEPAFREFTAAARSVYEFEYEYEWTNGIVSKKKRKQNKSFLICFQFLRQRLVSANRQEIGVRIAENCKRSPRSAPTIVVNISRQHSADCCLQTKLCVHRTSASVVEIAGRIDTDEYAAEIEEAEGDASATAAAAPFGEVWPLLALVMRAVMRRCIETPTGRRLPYQVR